MFIKVASSPRLSGIGMPSPILWSHLLKIQRIVLLSSLLWWELGTNSLITGPSEWLSFRRFTSKLSWNYPDPDPRKLCGWAGARTHDPGYAGLGMSCLPIMVCYWAWHKQCSCGVYAKRNWATSWENLFMTYANNKGTDQTARMHPRSLISAFVVRCI